MKVHIDPVKCEGYGTCAALAPEVFLLDEWGYAYVIDDGKVPEGTTERAMQAIYQCPMHAITSVSS